MMPFSKIIPGEFVWQKDYLPKKKKEMGVRAAQAVI